MVIVYYLEIDQVLSERQIEACLPLFPEYLVSKMADFVIGIDLSSAILGKLLLLRGLCDIGVGKDLFDIRYTFTGKPYLDGNLLYFSISHSDDKLVCAISDCGSVGIDIEKNRKIEVQNFRRQFGDDEWEYIISSQNINYTFLRYWTRKEAVVKVDGLGLGKPFRYIALRENFGVLENRTYHLSDLQLNPGSICSLASNRQLSSVDVRVLSLTDLLSSYLPLLHQY